MRRQRARYGPPPPPRASQTAFDHFRGQCGGGGNLRKLRVELGECGARRAGKKTELRRVRLFGKLADSRRRRRRPKFSVEYFFLFFFFVRFRGRGGVEGRSRIRLLLLSPRRAFLRSPRYLRGSTYARLEETSSTLRRGGGRGRAQVETKFGFVTEGPRTTRSKGPRVF